MNYEFKADAGTGLDIHLLSGHLSIREGESGKIKVDVETDDENFVVEQRGNQVYISSDRETRWISPSRKSAHVQIEAPAGVDATIGSAAAGIESSVDLGDVHIKLASGDIELAGVHRGTIKTATGDVEIAVVKDSVRASSASGDINIGKCEGKAEFSAASGDISIQDCRGPVSASSASGDITLEKFTGERANFKSMSGSAEIGVLPGTKLDLDASLLSGQLNLPEPSQNDSRKERRMKVRAKIVAGDLTINRVTE